MVKKRWQLRLETKKFDAELKAYRRLCRALEGRSEPVRLHVRDSVRRNTPDGGHGGHAIRFWIGILWRMDDGGVLATTFGGSPEAA